MDTKSVPDKVFSVIGSTFQLVSGLGKKHERRLWRDGVVAWDVDAAFPGVPAPTVERLRPAMAEAQAALGRRDVAALAARIPSGEHWRLFAEFGDDAAYLDIETGDDVVGFAGISAIGILDRHGPHLWLADDLESFPERAQQWSMLVTFNGLSFDVPILRQAFPDWQPPTCHVDLRHVLQRLGLGGGLKAIERRLPSLHLSRPAHLAGMGGWDACSLFRRGRDGDVAALRRFAEYNLYDAINLRTLMAYAYNSLVDAEAEEAPALREATRALAIPERGEVLYDVSKILLSL